MFKRMAMLAATVGCVVASAHAQTAYPTRPIKLIVPFTAGGITDNVARAVAEHASKQLGQPIVVDNRPGAGGNIGAGYAAHAEADGYTIFLGTQGTQVTNQYIYKSISYKPDADFQAVQGLIAIPNVIVANASRPYKTLPELIAYAKQHPGEVTYGSPGVGTGAHLAGELFQAVAGVKLRHVPYKGSAGSITDLLGGNLDIAFDYPVSAAPHVKSGRLRALAITGENRTEALPGTPTLRELGLAKATSESWTGVFVPKGTPPAAVSKLQAAFGGAAQEKTIQAKFGEFGGTPLLLPGPKFADYVHADAGKWKRVLETARVSAE
ncbi:ABC transporter substrate-binding protein [Cupriavidus sp. USMAA2-4]|uniref:Bug family tripartite tricarboxylate transporter substrate binding protein n=1 Tax=Cupriavidus sp. USMAA2-4 TaxID=876364 RepID=UPI0008A6FDA3|nr:tripartite tricarboxylate transporter substrate binding protein [Cupriavidus sp. USMAA2-4]AOY94465.1 ABC transporter substrate-binding protein [Cupriavidus sp. USMAA2-4]